MRLRTAASRRQGRFARRASKGAFVLPVGAAEVEPGCGMSRSWTATCAGIPTMLPSYRNVQARPRAARRMAAEGRWTRRPRASELPEDRQAETHLEGSTGGQGRGSSRLAPARDRDDQGGHRGTSLAEGALRELCNIALQAKDRQRGDSQRGRHREVAVGAQAPRREPARGPLRRRDPPA
jgi:hypothetical protein